MTAQIEFGLQDAYDGPGPLTPQDAGKVLTVVWENSRARVVAGIIRSPRLMVGGGGGGQGSGTSTIAGADDFIGATGPGTDGYAIIWDNTAGAFTLGAFEAVGVAAGLLADHVAEANPHMQYLLATDYNPITDHGALSGLADDDHTQYLLATGSRAGASSQAQEFTNGIVANVASTFNSHNPTLVGESASYGYYADSYMNGTGGGAQNVFRRAGGTFASPSATLNGMNLGALSFRGHNGTAFVGSKGLIAVTAAEDWTLTANGTAMLFQVVANGTTALATAISILNSRNVGLSITTPTALIDIAASTTTRASQRIRAGARPTPPNTGDIWDDGALVSYQVSSATNAIVNSFKLERGSSGTPAAGFGLGIVAQLESSTAETQDAGRLTWAWETATHASRASKGQLSAYYTTTERPAITWGANSTVALLSFFDVTTPVAKPTSGANLTNNVTSGGTDDTITNWTDLTTYATDAAAIRNAVYQLARKVKQLNDGLRTLGLMS